jgi:hypothetical protein
MMEDGIGGLASTEIGIFFTNPKNFKGTRYHLSIMSLLRKTKGEQKAKKIKKVPQSISDDALREVEMIRELSEQVRSVQGLAHGEIEELYHKANKFMNTYAEMSRKQYRAFRRDLDALAARVAELFKEGDLSKKHTKIFDRALGKMRLRDFYSARRLIHKFDDLIALKNEMVTNLEKYRRSYQEIENEIEGMKAELLRLKAVPKPTVSYKDVKTVEDAIADCKEGVNRLIYDYISTHPSNEVLKMILSACTNRDLGIPPPDNRQEAEELVNLLENHKEAREVFGAKNIHSLVQAANFTDARFGHIMAEYRTMKRLLQDNIGWLKGLSSPGGYFPRLSLEDDADYINSRIEAWLETLKMIPGFERVAEKLRHLSTLTGSGEFEDVKESARLYRTHGEMARLAHDGKIEDRIEETERAISRRTGELELLIKPEEVIANY